MRTEDAHPLRAEAERAYEGVRRDRDGALYIARARRAASECFACRERGEWLELAPTREGIDRMEAWLSARGRTEPTWLAFRGRALAPEDLRLLCEGIRLLERPAKAGEIAAYRMATAGRAARLLREKDRAYGGGLYACSLVDDILEQRKGEDAECF